MNIIFYNIETLEQLKAVYQPWGCANYNYEKIIKSNNLEGFIMELEGIYQYMSLTQLNDILWFDDNFCFQFINDELLNEEELQIKYNY